MFSNMLGLHVFKWVQDYKIHACTHVLTKWLQINAVMNAIISPS